MPVTSDIPFFCVGCFYDEVHSDTAAALKYTSTLVNWDVDSRNLYSICQNTYDTPHEQRRAHVRLLLERDSSAARRAMQKGSRF